MAAPPAKALPQGNNGGLKPTMQMASFVLPGVTEASNWGWEHQSSPSPAHPHPDLCPGPFVQVPKRGEKEGRGGESEESKGIRKLEEWGGEERQRERTQRKKQRKGESERENERETASCRLPRAASPALGEVNSKLDHMKLPFLLVTTG